MASTMLEMKHVVSEWYSADKKGLNCTKLHHVSWNANVAKGTEFNKFNIKHTYSVKLVCKVTG